MTTPGPDTPTETTVSASCTPWKAPAMNGLSETALAKTTSLAHPKPWASAVSSAVSRITSPMVRTAFMLIPAREEPMSTEEHTTSVSARACGIEAIRARSAGVAPLSTRAENPPMKSTPTALAAASRVPAYSVRSCSPLAAATRAIGVTATRLLMIGMPSSRSIPWHTCTSRAARVVIFS
ncbi:Uncharacterised protein [Mycobacteroides abscessus subsp. abscessus]|nr:Uncharacterised protein [Mycobacteroides abscessus subsp. abscessus]